MEAECACIYSHNSGIWVVGVATSSTKLDNS